MHVLKLDREMLIAAVAYHLWPKGRTTVLAVNLSEGFIPDPSQVRRRSGGSGTGARYHVDRIS